jgi:hypothetical protein
MTRGSPLVRIPLVEDSKFSIDDFGLPRPRIMRTAEPYSREQIEDHGRDGDNGQEKQEDADGDDGKRDSDRDNQRQRQQNRQPGPETKALSDTKIQALRHLT